MIKKCLFFAMSFSVVSFAESVDPVGIDFVNYFSATCRSQGSFTQEVLAQSSSLISVIENIKTDPNCATVAGAIGQLENLQSRLFQLDGNQSIKIEIERLTAQENELFQLLGQTNNVSVKEEINSALRQVQINKASLLAEDKANANLKGENVRDIYAKVVASSNSFFNTIANNQLCLQNNPNLLSNVTSLTGAIASTVSYANPVLGLGVAAGTDFIGRAIENLRNRKYNKMIRKISDDSAAVAGFQCALESLSYRWCEQRDALNLVELKLSVRNQKNDKLGFKAAFKLIDRDIPTLIEWLTTVRAGVPATTEADAGRQSRVFSRQAAVQSAEASGSGVISENKPLFDSATDDQDRMSVIRTIILTLSGTTCDQFSGIASGPLTDIYNPSYAPFYLLGLETIPLLGGEVPANFCTFDPLNPDEWPGQGRYIPSISQVQERYQLWIERARDRVDRELTIVTQPDALKVLSSVYEPTSSIYKYDAITAIETLKDFLKKYRPQNFSTNAFKKIYEDTEVRLTKLIEIITGAVIGDSYPDPTIALEEIFRLTELQYGAIVIQSRLEMITRVSIGEYLKTLDKSEGNIAAQLLAADSFLGALQKISGGNSNLSLIKADIMNGLDISQSNMKNFTDIFGAGINEILKNKYTSILEMNDPELNKAPKRTLANYCLLLSSMPVWPKNIDKKFCLGSQIASDVKGGPASPMITAKYLQSGFKVRKCGFRNFFRSSKIYSDWDIKLENQ